ncbi:MAG: gamma-glutamylcyclotransferase (GGCT)/AIG2-like uncharacterized protein YtfP [Methanobacteriota archaeon]|jgi:gamma-glutamylcyclotransferase (GGCT)/AIG2-like uncharacterized protein YtfP
MTSFVFLYGSLMRGFESHETVDLRSRAEFAGEAHCVGTLYDLGDHPGMTLEGNGRVRGELYRVTDDGLIQDLDRFERYYPESTDDSVYVRHLEEVVDRDLNAWVYLYNEPTEDANTVESGDWREYRSG